MANRGAREANEESDRNAQLREMREVADRTRRIETRLVKFFEFYGFDTQRKLPEITERGMELASMETSVTDISNAMPSDMGTVLLWHKNVVVGRYSRR